MIEMDDRVPGLWADFERRLKALERTQQLPSTTVGDTDDDAVTVEDVVSDAAVSNDAVLDLQDGIAAANDGVSQLDGVISASMAELDARLELAGTDLDLAREALEDSQQQITDAFGQQIDGLSDDVDTAITAAGGAASAATAAKAAADQAASDAATAKSTADAASSAALTASGLAASKGKVIYQASAPTGANATTTNLWIRSSDNKPFTYDGTTWNAITDKAATDAAAAAATAQQAATAASNAAAAAQATADGKPLILFSSTAGPSGTAPTGSIWFLWDSSKNVAGQWLQSGPLAAPAWTPQQIRSEVIANLDVAKLTVGSAAIADLVAQKIAAATGNFQTANVSNLFVTSGATLSQAVIDFLFVNVVQAKKITAGMIDVDSLNGVTITGATFQTAATGKRAVLGGTLMRFYDANNLQAGQIEGISNGAAGGVLRISPDGSDSAAIFIGAWSLAFGGTAAMRAPSLYVSSHYVDTMLSAATGKVIGGDTDWRAVPNGGSGYTGDGAGGYRVKNGDIRLRGQFNRPSGSVTAGDLIGLLPAGARPPYRSWFLASTGTGGIARCYLDTNGQVYVSSIIGTAGTYLIFEQKAVATVD